MKVIVTPQSVRIYQHDEKYVIDESSKFYKRFAECDDYDEFESILEDYLGHIEGNTGVYSKYIKENISRSTYLKYVDNYVFLNSMQSTPVPLLLAYRMLKAELSDNHKDLYRYINFWKKAILNPNAEARENMLTFIEKNNIKMDNYGNLITYRFVDLKNRANSDISYLPQIYKAVAQGVDIHNYYIDRFGVAREIDDDQTSIYDQLKESASSYTYTDNYTGTMDIKIGRIVAIPRKECDETQATCSKGLHTASFDWLERNAFYGSVALIVLVDPRDVVSVPIADNYGKMRSCSYFPIAVFNVGSQIDREDIEDFEIDSKYINDYPEEIQILKNIEAGLDSVENYPEDYFGSYFDLEDTSEEDDSEEDDDEFFDIIDACMYELTEVLGNITPEEVKRRLAKFRKDGHI